MQPYVAPDTMLLEMLLIGLLTAVVVVVILLLVVGCLLKTV